MKRLLESMGLKVKLPMILEVDNKATVDLANNLNTGGRTRHVEVKQYYLRELKELKFLLRGQVDRRKRERNRYVYEEFTQTGY